MALAALVALAAVPVGRLVPTIGTPVASICIGVVIASLWRVPGHYAAGLRFCSQQVLKASIVLLGAGLSLGHVTKVGAATLPVMVPTLLLGLAGAAVIGKRLGLSSNLRLLLGVGTSVCGASAIAAVAAVVDAEENEISQAIWTVFVFNIIAVVTFPLAGHLLGISEHAFGVWAGTAINDTSSVAAAAFSYGDQAGNDAVVVKLARTLMIIPICMVVALRRGGGSQARGETARTTVPAFIVWFVAAVLVNSAGLIPQGLAGSVDLAAELAIAIALGAVGVSIRMSGGQGKRARPALLGAALWISITLTSLFLIATQIDGWLEVAS